GFRSNLMFVPPVLVVLAHLGAGPERLVTSIAAGGTLTLGAWLLREGLRAEAAYHNRKVARRPAFPRKIFAAALAGVGIGLAASASGVEVFGASLYGLATAVLHLAAFGFDPLADKRLEGVDLFQQDRVARVVDEAEDYLNAMTDHIAALKDRRLDTRVAGFVASVRRLIRKVEEDPRDLTGARKYLRAAYETLLGDLEAQFAAQTSHMLLDDRTDMDIEIKVLRDRLQREGVRPE
ncbi:MAG: hypothetical protein EBZ26_09240, partial [Flavobacteriia bacterium]|nr:hypothetical protein [Flavobacteriia bacterium]